MGYFAMRGFVRVLEREVGDRRTALEIAARIFDGECRFNHTGYFVVRHSFLAEAIRDYLRDSEAVGYFYPWVLQDASGLPSRMFEVLQEAGEYETISVIMEKYSLGLVRTIMAGCPMELFATYDGNWAEVRVPSGAYYYVARTE